MAAEKEFEADLDKESGTKDGSLIDPIYRKFVRSVTRAIGSTEFYEYFMDAVANAENEFQFSNRRLVKTVDMVWVDAIEGTLTAFQNIVASPRNIIKEEELIVNVANARKAGSETVRHLAQHSALVEDFNFDTGDVRPSKLMQRYREDTSGLYENRLIFTTMEIAQHFVKIRHDALLAEMSDEFGAKLKVKTEMESATEHVHMDMFLHIKEIDGALETDEKHQDVFNRIDRINRVLTMLMGSTFAQKMAKLPRVKGTINKTNILKRNKDYHTVMLLLEFLKSYDQIGYSVDIVEQAPEINEEFEQDIYRNILFNYLILKGYLEDERDRKVPTDPEEKRTLHPKFIREIIEELVEDYNLPDVEVRRILIEELTREQLMEEEAAERRRLVEAREEQLIEEARRQEMLHHLEEEILRQKAEKYQELYLPELSYFREHLQEHIRKRRQEEDDCGLKKPKEDFADLVTQLEIAEGLKRQAQWEALRQKELSTYKAYMDELSYFQSHLPAFMDQRKKEEAQARHADELRRLARQERQAKRDSGKSGILKWRRG